MSENLIQLDQIILCYETFGDQKNPAILLSMGAGAQSIAWPDKFCNALADNGYYVIRYDNRDTGRSTCFDFEKSPYDLLDLKNDALNLLNKLEISKTHVIATSMGGFIAQLLAIYHPDKIASLTLIASTPDLSILTRALEGKKTNSHLTPPTQAMIQFSNRAPEKQGNALTEYLSYISLLDNDQHTKLDLKPFMDFFEKAKNRAKNLDAAGNHFNAIIKTQQKNITPLLGKINIPTWVIHGDRDPILPNDHGKEIAKHVKSAKFTSIKNMGHVLNNHFNIIQKHILLNLSI